MPITVLEAARLTGLSKTAIFKGIKQGRISAGRDEVSGEWRIEPAEIFRVYPAVQTVGQTPQTKVFENSQTAELAALRAEIEGLRRLVSTLENERDDLRARLDREADERRQLTAVLTDQRKPLETSAPAPGLWARLLGR